MKSSSKIMLALTGVLFFLVCLTSPTYAQVYRDPGEYDNDDHGASRDNDYDQDQGHRYGNNPDRSQPDDGPVQYARHIKHSLAQSYVAAGLRSGSSVFFVTMAPALLVAPLVHGSTRYCDSNASYGQIAAYAIPGVAIFLCNSYLELDEEFAAQTLVHELAHYVGVIFECSADNIARKAVIAAGEKFIPTGYSKACESGHEPYIDRIFSATGARP
jgi:hypothetical protein